MATEIIEKTAADLKRSFPTAEFKTALVKNHRGAETNYLTIAANAATMFIPETDLDDADILAALPARIEKDLGLKARPQA